jgi:hypothetical protein
MARGGKPLMCADGTRQNNTVSMHPEQFADDASAMLTAVFELIPIRRF